MRGWSPLLEEMRGGKVLFGNVVAKTPALLVLQGSRVPMCL